jgi:hypothetical protein
MFRRFARALVLAGGLAAGGALAAAIGAGVNPATALASTDSVLSSGGKATAASCSCYAVLASSWAGSSSSGRRKSVRSDTSLM